MATGTEGVPTKTSVYRNLTAVNLTDVQRKKGDSKYQTEINQALLGEEERKLQNILKTLDLGFDPDQFDEILGLNVGTHAIRTSMFSYYLYIDIRSLDYVLLGIDPKEKTFHLLVRDAPDEHTRFSLPAMTLEQVSYDAPFLCGWARWTRPTSL